MWWIDFQDSLGLTTIPSRIVFWSAAISVLVYLLKPQVLFKPDGSIRAWTHFDPGNAESVDFPFPIPAILLGTILGAI